MEPLAKLFGSPARLKTLRLFLFNQEGAFSLAEIAKRTKLSKEVVRREISDHYDVRFHSAGHIPGSLMFELVGDKRILFTGDLNVNDTRLMKGTKPVSCDILFMEGTCSRSWFEQSSCRAVLWIFMRLCPLWMPERPTNK